MGWGGVEATRAGVLAWLVWSVWLVGSNPARETVMLLFRYSLLLYRHMTVSGGGLEPTNQTDQTNQRISSLHHFDTPSCDTVLAGGCRSLETTTADDSAFLRC
jgi:hypothetical protein